MFHGRNFDARCIDVEPGFCGVKFEGNDAFGSVFTLDSDDSGVLASGETLVAVRRLNQTRPGRNVFVAGDNSVWHWGLSRT